MGRFLQFSVLWLLGTLAWGNCLPDTLALVRDQGLTEAIVQYADLHLKRTNEEWEPTVDALVEEPQEKALQKIRRELNRPDLSSHDIVQLATKLRTGKEKTKSTTISEDKIESTEEEVYLEVNRKPVLELASQQAFNGLRSEHSAKNPVIYVVRGRTSGKYLQVLLPEFNEGSPAKEADLFTLEGKHLTGNDP